MVVEKFRATYENLIPILTDKSKWHQSDNGFVFCVNHFLSSHLVEERSRDDSKVMLRAMAAQHARKRQHIDAIFTNDMDTICTHAKTSYEKTVE